MNIETTSSSVPTIVCGRCRNGIKQILGNVPDVSGVSVDIAPKTVPIKHDQRARAKR